MKERGSMAKKYPFPSQFSMPKSVLCDSFVTANAVKMVELYRETCLAFHLQEEHVVMIIPIFLHTEETMMVLSKCVEVLILTVVSAKLSPSLLVKLWTIPFFLIANAPHPFLVCYFLCALYHD